MMIKLYGFKLSQRVIKVQLCANALHIPYKFIDLNLLAGEGQKEQFLKLHPAGKVPVIDDDGFILFESNAIIKYLSRKQQSAFYPNELKQQALIDQWCDFISMHIDSHYIRVLYNFIVAPKLGLAVDENSIQCGREFLARFLPILDHQLQKTPYVAGDQLTIADFCLLANLEPSEVIKVDISQYPKLSAWRKQLQQQDFYQQLQPQFDDVMTVWLKTNS